MKVRQHRKRWNAKTKQRDLNTIYVHLNNSPKRYDFKEKRFMEWLEKRRQYLMSIAKKFKQKLELKQEKSA